MEQSPFEVAPNNVDQILVVPSTDAGQNFILPPGFRQIECDATKEQISFFFSNLATENNPTNDQPYMKQNDIDELIEKNFLIFGKDPTGKYFDINLTHRQKGKLKCFILEFYEKYEAGRIGTKMKYVNFLRWNFELFKNDNPHTLNGNMNTSKKPSQKTRIPTTK